MGGKAAGTGEPWTGHSLHSQKRNEKAGVGVLGLLPTDLATLAHLYNKGGIDHTLNVRQKRLKKILVRLFGFKNILYRKPKNSVGNKVLEKLCDWLSKLCYFNSSTLFYKGKQIEYLVQL